jgi:hypothetical protein
MAPYFVQRRGDEGCRYGHDQSSQGLERERHIRGIGAPENWNLTININDTTRGFGVRYGSQYEKSRNRYFRVEYMTLKFRERIAKNVKLQKIAPLENQPEDVASAVENCTW